jgi:hypothetical protein
VGRFRRGCSHYGVRYRRSMVLLSRLIRHAAITGRTDTIDPSWFAGRQGGRWVERTVRAAMPTAAPTAHRTEAARRDPAETLRELTELHQRGVLTQAEFDGLRARLRV